MNLPETATVEDVEEVYYQGWKMGLKALAIYRNNCKVGQPLSDAREKKADVNGCRRRPNTSRFASGCRSVVRRRPCRSRSLAPRVT